MPPRAARASTRPRPESGPRGSERRHTVELIVFWSAALALLCVAGLAERGKAEPTLLPDASTARVAQPVVREPSTDAAVPQARAAVTTQRFSVNGPNGVRETVLAIWSRPAHADDKLPMVIAFHGKGESQLGPARGYPAWVERYGLASAYQALLAPPLSARAFGGLVRPRDLTALNEELTARPFQGVVTLCVYTPDLLPAANAPDQLQHYADWVAHQLVPEARRALPIVSNAPRQLGVDGVSLGGMVALEVGLRFPEVFGAVGAMQPAIRGREALLAALAERARSKAKQNLRLLSSERDPLLPVTQDLSRELRKLHVAHQLVVTPGGHDYAFNRGPGAIELLHFQDRALRELPQ